MTKRKITGRHADKLVSPQLKNRSYTLYSISHDGRSITCNLCGGVSYDPQHVRRRFCPGCLTFHEDHTLMRRLDEGLHVPFVMAAEESSRVRIAA
jgi:hypothetical protein